MPLLKDNRILAAKIESVAGTAVSLSASDAGMNVYNVTFSADIPMSERILQGSMSRLAGIPGARAAKCAFSLDAYGSGSAGTAPVWASTLLPACGFAATTGGSYGLVSSFSAMKCLSMGVYEDGLLKQLHGAMGTFKIAGEDGKPLRFDFEFTGVYTSTTDVALISPTYPSRVPPAFLGATLTIGSYTPVVSKLDIDLGNNVSLRQDVTNAAGYASAAIGARKVSGSCDPEAVLVASYDAYGTWLGGTTAALTVSVGSSGDAINITAPALQLTSVNEGDRDGIQSHDLTFDLLAGSQVANSEIVVDF